MTDTVTPDPDTTDVTAAVDRYLATWNETDPTARAELAASALADDVWYRDPLLEADGLGAYDAMIAAVQAQLPGHVMRRTTAVDAHHGVVRFGWALAAPGAAPTFEGIDVAVVGPGGTLARIVGFTGELAPAASA